MEKFENEVEAANALHEKFESLKKEIRKVIVGQDDVIRLVISSFFCHSHSLLVGVPGLAKTLLINTVASAMNLKFNRIQFTPDLMPSDIIGAETLDKDRNFKFIKGPIFNNIILADEINRTPPKTQAALLESMQEKNVTVAGETYALPDPFFVLATQNPIEQEGTYPLPEAQLDRFMFNITLDYPSYEDELNIVKTSGQELEGVEAVMTSEEILYFQKLVNKVPVTNNVIEFAVKLVHSTRPNTEKAYNITNEYLEWGAGPRASQFLIKGAKCNALLSGKYSPDIEDVKAVAIPVLRHRLVKNFKADAEGMSIEKIIEELIWKVEGKG
ncbi:ATPase AAA [Marivirga tractuosa]|uniref:ATPase associated with various cellular activities AAA_3 n=1 Tax=Marivirga tractuosa (strain ATCC 23168 / DSM 4126 / NBRC 15989 / NCIMB 1408 / VKM B-1430 / H-43) TaxID=643867 RepID=E4TSN8_MARTH|nr:AAA family ATPase [Marivirga tractuosa]ADR21848.1 ATPase associated with various cellular activities AAA_3 [Marivirga tractuosa DSM 4126]BDD13694.1 ATPase AAA [Marivirga tractuosa]